MTGKHPDNPAVFHEKHPEDQKVVATITRNVKAIVRSHASKRAWATRKKMMAARAQREKEGGRT